MARGGAGIVAGALVALGLMVGPAAAESFAYATGGSGAAAPAVGEARPLAGWADFCRRIPAECAFDPGEPATVTLSARTLSVINAVNRSVNGSVRPVTDQEHWGIADRWDLPADGLGDCEDFQLLKRKLLAEQGLPRRAMRMTVVIDDRGEGHAVLMIRTNRGDLVLDNKTSVVLPWHETGYLFVKRESQDRLGWVSLGGATSPASTANR